MRKIWTGLMFGLLISACNKRTEQTDLPAVPQLRQSLERSLQQFAGKGLERGWIRGRWQDQLDYGQLVRLPQGGYLIPWKNRKHEHDSVSWASLFCFPSGKPKQVMPVIMEYYGKDEAIDGHSMQQAMKAQAGAADGKYRMLRPDGKLIVELDYQQGTLAASKKIECHSPARQGRAALRSVKCLEWFLITTHFNSDGSTDVYEDYLGTTCEGCGMFDFLSESTMCPSQEQGGGGNSDCSSNDEAKSQAVSEVASSLVTWTGLKERQVDCSWTFYRNSFNIWSFMSLETGTQFQVYKRWYWKNFKHVAVAQQGYAFGISVSCDVLSATPSFNDNLAMIELNFKITKSVLCKDFPITFWDTGVESAQFYASSL